MMKYLKKFATNTDRSTYEEGDNYTEPYVSLVDNGGDLSYNHIFQLTDRVQYPYPNGKEKATVVYTKTFPSSQVNKLRPWCMPFDYIITDEDRQNFTFYYISEIKDGIEIHTENFEGTVLLANTPYLLIPNKEGTFNFKANSVKLSQDKPNNIILQLESTNYIYNFYQVYTPFTVTESNHYAITPKGALAQATIGSIFPSYMWYIKVVSKS